MQRHSMFDHMRDRGFMSLLVAMVLCSGLGAAQAQTVTLDAFSLPLGDKGFTLAVERVEVTGTNLTRDEVAALFSPQTPKDQAAAILLKMRAQKFSIPLVTITGRDGRFSLHGIEASNVSEGRIEHLGFASGEGAGSNASGGATSLTIGALDVVEADFSVLFEALRTGDLIGRQVPAKGLLWKGAQASFPDNETPASAPGGNLMKVVLGPLAVDTVYQGKIPVHAFLDWKGLSIGPPAASRAGRAMADFGYPSIDFSLRATVAYDPASQIYKIDDFSILAPRAGMLSFKMDIAGVGTDFLAGNREAKAAALQRARMQALNLGYADDGLFGKIAAFVARQQNKTPEVVRREWSALATQFIPLGLGGDPASLKIAEAVARFIANPTVLTLSARAKGEAPKFGDLKGLTRPGALLTYYELGAVAGR